MTVSAKCELKAATTATNTSNGRAVTVAYHKLSDTFVIKAFHRMLGATRWTEDDLRRLKLLK